MQMFRTPTQRFFFFFSVVEARGKPEPPFLIVSMGVKWKQVCRAGGHPSRGVADLQPLQIYGCSRVSKYKFIDILRHMWETCYPGTIDGGEHPTVNTGPGQFKI